MKECKNRKEPNKQIVLWTTEKNIVDLLSLGSTKSLYWMTSRDRKMEKVFVNLRISKRKYVNIFIFI